MGVGVLVLMNCAKLLQYSSSGGTTHCGYENVSVCAADGGGDRGGSHLHGGCAVWTRGGTLYVCVRVSFVNLCSLVPALKVPPCHVPLDSCQFGTALNSNCSMGIVAQNFPQLRVSDFNATAGTVLATPLLSTLPILFTDGSNVASANTQVVRVVGRIARIGTARYWYVWVLIHRYTVLTVANCTSGYRNVREVNRSHITRRVKSAQGELKSLQYV
ncbi:hypothetical protein CBL_09687 [Carabus blaptoides fortunei]